MAGLGSDLLMMIGGFWLLIVLILYLIDRGSSGEPLLWLIFVIPGLLTFLVGFILFLVGKAQIRGYQRKAEIISDNRERLERQGDRTVARVTYVDKNYGLLVNNAPVYSIIEYQFTDYYGKLVTAKKLDVPSELVVRQQITVGDEVSVMYDRKNPAVNQLLLQGYSE